MFTKPRPKAMGVIAWGFIAIIFLSSCDPVERHKILTYFFDGVPPLEDASYIESLDPNSVEYAQAVTRKKNVWTTHKAQEDCTNCHGFVGKVNEFSRETKLTDTVPGLCFKCHQEYENLDGWVHGPVAMGECTFCHEPHKSRNEYLLKYPVPDLCFNCHEKRVIDTIKGHGKPDHIQCLKCHEGHASEARPLLKPELIKELSH